MDCYILVVILWEGLRGFAGQGVGLVYLFFQLIINSTLYHSILVFPPHSHLSRSFHFLCGTATFSLFHDFANFQFLLWFFWFNILPYSQGPASLSYPFIPPQSPFILSSSQYPSRTHTCLRPSRLGTPFQSAPSLPTQLDSNLVSWLFPHSDTSGSLSALAYLWFQWNFQYHLPFSP